MNDNALKTGPSRLTWGAIFAVLALLLLAGGGWYDRVESGQLRRKSFEEISAIGELKAGQIEQWRKDRLADATRTAKDPLMKKAVADFLGEPGNASLRTELLGHLQLDQKTYGYFNVVLLDLKDNLLLSADNQPEPTEPDHDREATAALANGRATLSDLYRTPQNMILIDTVAPILDDAGRPQAFLEMNNDAEAYLFPLVQYWPTPSQSAETLLVRREGDQVLFLNELRNQSNAALNLTLPLTQTDAPSVQAALGLKGTFEGTDYRGVPVLSDLRSIPGSDWLMVVKVNQDEILSEAHYRAGVIFVVVALIILLVGAMLATFYRQRQAGLFQDLYRKKREALEEFRTTLYSIGDAVITTDRETRIQRMNPVGEQLSGWTEEQARNRPLSEVLRIVEEETRIPVEDQTREALEEGKVTKPAEHSVLIARDGAERPIAESFAPVFDDSGATTGLVMVFRDQSNERAAQAALEKSEKLYHSLFENMLDGFAYCRMIFDGDRPIDFQYLKVNSRFEALTGLKDVEGKRVTEIIPGILESDPGLFEIYGRVARTGLAERFETFLVALQIWFSVSVYSPAPDHFVAVFDNIDDRKRAEEALHVYQIELETQNADLRQTQSNLEVSQNRYFELYDLAPVGYLSLNANGLILEANLTTAAMMEREKNDLVNRPLSQFISPPDQDIHFLNFRQLLQSGAPQAYELRLLKSDSSNFWARIEAAAGKDAEGGLVCRVAISDISLRKRAEEALRKSEEKYRLIAESTTDVIAIHDLDLNATYVSPSEERLRGFTPAESMAQTIDQLLTPDSLVLAREVLAKELLEEANGVIDPNRTKTLELEEYRKDGSTVWVEVVVSFLRDAAGKPTGILSVARDITTRKAAAEAARISEEKYLPIADISEVINIRDMELNLIYASPSVERLRGYTVPEAMKQTIEQILTPESLRRARAVLAEEMALWASGKADPEKSVKIELEGYHKDGSLIPVEVTVLFLRDQAMKPIGIVTVARKIPLPAKTDDRPALEMRPGH